MKIICDACSAKYSIADEKVRGKVFKIRCKKCSNIIVVRGTEDEEAAVQSAVPEKETQVYNYNDPESEGEWHLVIDDEQVGPMTADEVRARFAAGDVDSESFIWKDGMGDWEPLTEIPEFADLAASEEKTVANAGVASVGGTPDYAAEEPKSEADSIFGGVDMNESSSPAADDIFASQTVAQKPSAEAAAMFGTAGIDSGNENIFGEEAASASMSEDQQLTGQRSDNSVLFSISDLAGANKSSQAPASSAPASAPSSTGVTEGSGLIDIRSMAQVYLGDKNSPAPAGPATGSDDDLPVFSQTGFENAAPVLLQTESGSDDKLKYLLMAAVGLLALVAVALVFVLLRGGDKDSEDGRAEIEEATSGDVAEDDTGSKVDTDTDTDSKAPVVTQAPPKQDEPVKDEPVASNDTTKSTSSNKTNKKDPKKDRRKQNTTKTVAKNDPPPKKDPAPKSSDSGCDEISCLVTPNKACCKRYRSGSSKSSGSSSSSNLPEQLSRSDVTKGISKIKSKVNACGSKHSGKGTVKARMKIAGSGRVSSVNTSGGSAALSRCVASAVKKASFRKTQKGMTVTYPFVFK